jgi:hypothetical protein
MPSLRGRILRASDRPLPERALLAAVLLQAIREAQHGDLAAADFLDAVFEEWRSLFGLEVRDWRQAQAVCKIGRRTNEAHLSTSAAAVYTREYRRRRRQG